LAPAAKLILRKRRQREKKRESDERGRAARGSRG